MQETLYSYLVEKAKNERGLNVSRRLRDSLSVEKSLDSGDELESLARDLKAINDHIEVDSEVFSQASSDYENISAKIVEKLKWPNNAIQIIPQGSASTKTLIKSPGNEKFDIDAVCSVDLSMIEVQDPMAFYQKIGDALQDWNPSPKKRCWKIDFSGRRYYIEFTPSVPLDKVPASTSESIIFTPAERYRGEALAVVDTPSQQWKTSNPAGFSKWVSDQSSRPLLTWLIEKSMGKAYRSDSVSPVPDQEVEISDTLRLAIRLLKRHRDMSVRRNLIEPELKPISIVIVTLLTQCYEGLADQGDTYNHPIELFIDLVELMPFMVERRGNDYWVANPTVDGENFAERWNQNLRLKDSFDAWISLLRDDLNDILSQRIESERRRKIKEVFGCTAAHSPPPPTSSGLARTKPTRPHKVPPTKGLAKFAR